VTRTVAKHPRVARVRDISVAVALVPGALFGAAWLAFGFSGVLGQSRAGRAGTLFVRSASMS
jgi:hypothetical protein